MIFLPRAFIQSHSHRQNNSCFLTYPQSFVLTARIKQSFCRIQILQDKLCQFSAICSRNLQTLGSSVFIPKIVHNRNIAKTSQQIEMPIGTEEIHFPFQRQYFVCLIHFGNRIVMKTIIGVTQPFIAFFPFFSATIAFLQFSIQASFIVLCKDVITVFLFTENPHTISFQGRKSCI